MSQINQNNLVNLFIQFQSMQNILNSDLKFGFTKITRPIIYYSVFLYITVLIKYSTYNSYNYSVI